MVLYASGDVLQELATGDTGTVKIAANGRMALQIPIASENAALVSAIVAFATGDRLRIMVRGEALVAMPSSFPGRFRSRRPTR